MAAAGRHVAVEVMVCDAVVDVSLFLEWAREVSVVSLSVLLVFRLAQLSSLPCISPYGVEELEEEVVLQEPDPVAAALLLLIEHDGVAQEVGQQLLQLLIACQLRVLEDLARAAQDVVDVFGRQGLVNQLDEVHDCIVVSTYIIYENARLSFELVGGLVLRRKT